MFEYSENFLQMGDVIVKADGSKFAVEAIYDYSYLKSRLFRKPVLQHKRTIYLEEIKEAPQQVKERIEEPPYTMQRGTNPVPLDTPTERPHCFGRGNIKD